MKFWNLLILVFVALCFMGLMDGEASSGDSEPNIAAYFGKKGLRRTIFADERYLASDRVPWKKLSR